MKLDRSDDLLNPTSGYRIQGNLVPYRSFAGSHLTFVSERVAGSFYKRLGRQRPICLCRLGRRVVDPGRLAPRTAGRQADLCRRRRLGAGLRVPDGRAARRQQQSDRRPVEPRIEPGGAHQDDKDDRHRAVFRRRQLLSQPAAAARTGRSFMVRGSGCGTTRRSGRCVSISRRRCGGAPADALVQVYISLGQAF